MGEGLACIHAELRRRGQGNERRGVLPAPDVLHPHLHRRPAGAGDGGRHHEAAGEAAAEVAAAMRGPRRRRARGGEVDGELAAGGGGDGRLGEDDGGVGVRVEEVEPVADPAAAAAV